MRHLCACCAFTLPEVGMLHWDTDNTKHNNRTSSGSRDGGELSEGDVEQREQGGAGWGGGGKMIGHWCLCWCDHWSVGFENNTFIPRTDRSVLEVRRFHVFIVGCDFSYCSYRRTFACTQKAPFCCTWKLKLHWCWWWYYISMYKYSACEHTWCAANIII